MNFKLAAQYLNYGGLVSQAIASRISGKPHTWMRRQVKSGKIASVEIDGVEYVALPSLICWMVENEADVASDDLEKYIYDVAKRELVFWGDVISKNKRKRRYTESKIRVNFKPDMNKITKITLGGAAILSPSALFAANQAAADVEAVIGVAEGVFIIAATFGISILAYRLVKGVVSRFAR